MLTPDSPAHEIAAVYDEEHQLELEARAAELRAANAKIVSVSSELERVRSELVAYQGSFSTTPEEYDAKIADMRDQLDAKSIAMQVANERIEALSTSLETVRNSLKAKEAELGDSPTNLQRTVEGLQLQLAKQNEALLSAQAKQADLVQSLESARSRASVLEAELERRPNISIEQLNEIQEMSAIRERESAEAVERIKQLDRSLELATIDRDRLTQLQTEIDIRDATIATSNSQIHTLEAKLVSLTKELQLHETNAQAQSALVDSSKHSTDTLYYQISSLHADLMNMQKEMRRLQSQVVTRDETVPHLATHTVPAVDAQNNLNPTPNNHGFGRNKARRSHRYKRHWGRVLALILRSWHLYIRTALAAFG